MFGFLHGSDRHNNCVTDYIHFQARVDKAPRSVNVIEKLKILNDGLNKNNKKPFVLPIVSNQEPLTNEFLHN